MNKKLTCSTLVVFMYIADIKDVSFLLYCSFSFLHDILMCVFVCVGGVGLFQISKLTSIEIVSGKKYQMCDVR